MDVRYLTDWLLRNAGPVIRFRVATELSEEHRYSAFRDLLSSDIVRYWVKSFRPDCSRCGLHGAKSGTYENAAGKLYDFGLRKGMPILDRKTLPFRRWLKQEVAKPIEGYLPVFHRTLVASFLAMLGYGDDEAVESWTFRRLDTLYPFAKRGDLSEMYVSKDKFISFPKAFKSSPLVNPDLYPNEELKLPWIHDMYAFLHSPPIMKDATSREKVETVIKFILTQKYQRLRVGYGVVRHRSRYYMMGWSVHLPSFFSGKIVSDQAGRLLLWLELFSRSEEARASFWYRRAVEELSKYATEKSLILFPREFLPEKKIGVWILGMRMGLEENRRKHEGLLCESTFRFLAIRNYLH